MFCATKQPPNDNVNVNPGTSVPPKSITSVSTASQCELIKNRENNSDKDIALNMMPVRHMSNHPVSPMLESPNSEFVNNYNLRCMVDLLVDEIVSTEIDQDESDNEGEDLPGDILPCDDQPRCTYHTVTTLSMKV